MVWKRGAGTVAFLWPASASRAHLSSPPTCWFNRARSQRLQPTVCNTRTATAGRSTGACHVMWPLRVACACEKRGRNIPGFSSLVTTYNELVSSLPILGHVRAPLFLFISTTTTTIQIQKKEKGIVSYLYWQWHSIQQRSCALDDSHKLSTGWLLHPYCGIMPLINIFAFYPKKKNERTSRKLNNQGPFAFDSMISLPLAKMQAWKDHHSAKEVHPPTTTASENIAYNRFS